MKNIMKYSTSNSMFLALTIFMLYALINSTSPVLFITAITGFLLFAHFVYIEFKAGVAAGSDFQNFEETVKNFDIDSITPEDFGTLDSIDADKAAGRTMIEGNLQKTETIQKPQEPVILKDMDRKNIIKYSVRIVLILMILILSFSWLSGGSNNNSPMIIDSSSDQISHDSGFANDETGMNN